MFRLSGIWPNAVSNCDRTPTWADSAEPTVVAENELMGAANSIEEAAIKLAKLRPRQVHVRVQSFECYCSHLYFYSDIVQTAEGF